MHKGYLVEGVYVYQCSNCKKQVHREFVRLARFKARVGDPDAKELEENVLRGAPKWPQGGRCASCKEKFPEKVLSDQLACDLWPGILGPTGLLISFSLLLGEVAEERIESLPLVTAISVFSVVAMWLGFWISGVIHRIDPQFLFDHEHKPYSEAEDKPHDEAESITPTSRLPFYVLVFPALMSCLIQPPIARQFLEIPDVEVQQAFYLISNALAMFFACIACIWAIMRYRGLSKLGNVPGVVIQAIERVVTV